LGTPAKHTPSQPVHAVPVIIAGSTRTPQRLTARGARLAWSLGTHQRRTPGSAHSAGNTSFETVSLGSPESPGLTTHTR
jgi:hypothetical protein